MKFSYSTITAAVLSTLSISAFAGDVDFYGKGNISFQSSDHGAGSFTDVQSNASRIGFKGGQDLGNGLEVIFKAEFQVDLDGDSDKGDSITDRNQYVGLKGFFGEVLLGNNDTMLKQSQGKVDLFNDDTPDIKQMWKGENRMDNNISYKSPKFGDFQLGVTYLTEGDAEGEDAMSIALFYGDKTLKKSKIFASVAFDSEVKGYDTTRATVQGKVAGFTVGAILHAQENILTGEELDGMMVSAKYSFDKLTFEGQIQTAEVDTKGGDERTGITVGTEYKLASSTKVYAFYSSFDMDSKADREYLAAGIEYKF
jgi:predicted porin